MYGDKVKGGYEAAFVYTEQQVGVVREVLANTTWTKDIAYRGFYDTIRREAPMGPIRARIRPGTGFAGVRGFEVVVPTKREVEAADQSLRNITYTFAEGERVRTVVPIIARGGSWPVGRAGTVVGPYAGYVQVRFDDEPETVKDCHWTWVERIEK